MAVAKRLQRAQEKTVQKPVERRFKFTRAKLDKLPLPASSWEYYYDEIVPSLAVGIGPSGARTFYLVKKIAGRTERIKLERDGVISIDKARDAAQAQINALASGVNPADARRASRHGKTLREVFEDFKQHRRSRRGGFLTEKTKRGYGFDFDNHLAGLAGRSLASITREQIATLHSRIGREHPTTANRVLALVSSMYSHADERKLYSGRNPAQGIKKFPENARERFVQAAEFPKFMAALSETPEPWRWVFALAIFTGARRDNVLGAQRADINVQERTWRIPSTKSGKSVTLPLSGEALAILAQIPRVAGTDYLFPSHGASGRLQEPKKPWADLIARAELPGLKLHDLRRTLGSWQAGTGASLVTIGKSLGHSTPQATQVYARLANKPVSDAIDVATAAMLAAARKGKGNRGAAVRKVLGKGSK
jgi:integrase